MKTKSYTAARAKAAREQLGLTRAQVVDLMASRGFDWAPNTQANIENDRKTKWSIPEMLAYAEVLNQPVMDVFPLESSQTEWTDDVSPDLGMVGVPALVSA